MNDSTQDYPGRGDAEVAAAVSTADQTDEATRRQGRSEPENWPDAASDPGSGVPGGGRHKYASGKTYCGTEN